MRVMCMYECVPGIIYFVLLLAINTMVEIAQDTREQRDEKFSCGCCACSSLHGAQRELFRY